MLDISVMVLSFYSTPARNQAFDVVLVDTAGRMQDNAPLMTALAKLIAVNMPDLVLFVGEALVGNEAVDQLVNELLWNPSPKVFSKTQKLISTNFTLL